MKKNSETNFWISYADLMAGLLFVFILLIGAIIVKYSLLQTESNLLEQTLKEEKIALEKNRKELIQKELKIKNTVTDLEKAKKDLKKIKFDFDETKKDLKSKLIENEKLKIYLKEEKSLTNKLDTTLKEKDEKIVLYKKEKLNSEEEISQLTNLKNTLEKNLKDIESNLEEKNKELNSLLEDILEKKSLISSFKETNSLLDDEIKVLTRKLEDTQNKHELLSKDLLSTKSKIKNLTGIKIKVISLLKNKLGKNMQIDPKNGAIRLSSNILFDEGEFELKDSSKASLKDSIYDYFYTILENEEINQHIDKIIIEGHTNSKGAFLYNLELSQKRAYSVMDFLLSLDFQKKENLKRLIVASGRSFLDPIYDKNGLEDKDESRRIEIKFSLKNEEAIKEIANILD